MSVGTSRVLRAVLILAAALSGNQLAAPALAQFPMDRPKEIHLGTVRVGSLCEGAFTSLVEMAESDDATVETSLPDGVTLDDDLSLIHI